MENDSYWQKNNFLLFAKWLKVFRFFEHLHSKFEKSAIMTPTFFSQKVSIWGIKTRRILC
jgi:hypothetical protein